ncbi:hypothetical protein ACXWON_09785, partial [Streptococcus pyogenes]
RETRGWDQSDHTRGVMIGGAMTGWMDGRFYLLGRHCGKTPLARELLRAKHCCGDMRQEKQSG